MRPIKEIVIISGKGGTGKTTITASLTDLIPDKIIVDADVDAADMFILMKPEMTQRTAFKGKNIAKINTEQCIGCGLCRHLCRFHAILKIGNEYETDALSCDGCSLCSLACPEKAITMKERIVGEWFHSVTQWGDFIHARLIPGAENSGSLTTMVKRQARLLAEKKNIGLLLVDGPPGIGCPAIAAISGADLVLMVTEPSYSGISDLKRAYQLTQSFNIKSAIVINRFDINLENTRKIEAFAEQYFIPIYAKIPHLDCVRESISKKELPSRNCNQLKTELSHMYNKIKTELSI